MIPGMSGMMEEGGEEEASAKLKRMIFITDAMRADELDSDGLIFVSFYDLLHGPADNYRSASIKPVTLLDSTAERDE
jgi:hypothetical protein